MNLFPRWVLLGCLAVLTLPACSSTQPAALDAASAVPAASPAAPELEALYWARKDSARMNFTAADVRFMTGMIGHHAQALIMSALAPTNGAGPAVQTLAARIINAQKDEIATMQQWLRERGQPVPEVHIDGLQLMIHGAGGHGGGHHHDHSQMPGMLTQAQLVDDLFATDGAAQDEAAFKLASEINVDQTTEIARMKLMLDRLPNGSLDR